MVFDPPEPIIDPNQFQDWSSSVYGANLKEELPADMPEARGKGFVMSAYVEIPCRR